MAGCKGSDQEQWSLLYLPHLIFVLHRKTKITGPQNTTARITKLCSYKGSGRQEVEVGGEMAQGERVFKSVQARDWQMLEKKLQKNLRSFQTHQCLKSILVAGRFCLTCTRDKNLDSSERRECGQGPWQGGPCLPWEGMEVNQEKSCHSILPIPPGPSRWRVTDSAACSSLQFGRRRVR